MNKMHIRLISFALILSIFIIFNISARGCGVRSSKDTKTGSSNNYNTFTINAPSAFSATGVSSSQINLYWQDNSNNEDGFAIERKIGIEGIWEEISRVGIDTAEYLDESISSNNTYYYRIYAFNTIGDRSTYSNEVSATPSAMLRWSAIAAGYTHTIARALDGSIWSWGSNLSDANGGGGQLGLGDTGINNRVVPNQIGSDRDWQTIACGEFYSLAIKNNRMLWDWGSNTAGQLGMGDYVLYDNWEPFTVGSDADWSNATGGFTHTIALKTNGTLWSCGWSNFGQLGLGDLLNRTTLTQIGSDSDWFIITAGGAPTGVITAHSMAIKTNGTIWSWGKNQYGQLGLSDYTNRNTPTAIGNESDWNSVVAGWDYTVALKNNRTIWTSGLNWYGTLGFGDTSTRNTFTQIGNASDWSAISAGAYHIVTIKTNRNIWSWGWNAYGQLGLGDYINRTTPAQMGIMSDWSIITAGGDHTFAIKTNGIIWAWGANYTGQLGVGDISNRNIPVSVRFGLPNPATFLSAEISSPTQIDLFWIDNSDNEDGFRIERKINYNGTYEQVAMVGSNAVSWSDTEVLGATSYYYCVKSYNIIGNSLATNEVYIAISGDWSTVACGQYHSIGLRTNRTLWGWGDNRYCQMGTRDGESRYTPTQIGTDSIWSDIVCGANHIIGMATDKTIWGWGANEYGQLGVADNENKDVPTPIGSDSDWSIISGGNYHTAACKTNRTLWTWGHNNFGQLGLGHFDERNTPTQLGTDSDWNAVAAGGSLSDAITGHTVAIKNNGTILVWGCNEYGQLGLGDSNNRDTPSQVGINSDWSAVAVGEAHVLAIKNNPADGLPDCQAGIP
jgi:alpha-tubulin suppressor-like RCC1 family protein